MSTILIIVLARLTVCNLGALTPVPGGSAWDPFLVCWSVRILDGWADIVGDAK